MTNIFSLPGLISAGLLLTCSCAYIRRSPALRNFFLTEKKGGRGTPYKMSVIGTRLHAQVAFSCVVMGLYLLFAR